jgi:SAM-dependent methyltransferase
MLHLLESEAGLDAWSRILLLGPRSPIDARLARGRPSPVRQARLSARPDGLALDSPDRAFTHVIAWDYLQRVPPLGLLLQEVGRVLAPGGVFVFTLPFHYHAVSTITRLGHVPRRAGMLPAEFGGDVHDVGWDILDRLHQVGFARARAHHYWSRELGYLGPNNFLFSASV